MRSLLQTPRKVTGQVLRFCSEHGWASPDFIRVEPVEGALPNECFFNVRDHIAKMGGQLVLGWCVWLWPRVMIEGEHHCLWRSPGGDLLDITPKLDGETRVLFATDENAAFDWDGPFRRDNVRRAITSDRRIGEFFEVSRAIYGLATSNASVLNGKLIHRYDPTEMDRLKLQQSNLARSLWKKHK